MGQLATLIIAVTVLLVLAEYGRRTMKKIAATWQATAKKLGGSFEPSGGSWWRRSPMQIDAKVEGVSVHVDHYTVQHGKSSTTYTRITAPASAPPNLSLRIYVEGFFSAIGKALGTQDVDVGDREFDDAFMVKANDEELARLWIGPKFRRTALDTREYSLNLAASQVTSTRIGIEPDGERLERAMREVALLAGRGKKLLKDWRTLAEEMGGNVSGRALAWPGDTGGAIQIEQRGVIVTVAVDAEALPGKPRRLGTVVSAARIASSADNFALKPRVEGRPAPADPFGDPAFAREYALHADNPDRAARRFSDELRRDILALDPEQITGDENGITLLLEGAQLKRKPIDSAIAIVAALAAPLSEGPYR